MASQGGREHVLQGKAGALSASRAPGLGQRGQESVPFEVFIAVTIMGFVLLLGLGAMDYFKRLDCDARLEDSMTKFKLQLESVVVQTAPQDLVLTIPSDCFFAQRHPTQPDVEFPMLALEQKADDVVCASRCEVAKRDCVLLDFLSTTTTRQLCVGIPSTTSFPGTAGVGSACTDRTAAGFQLQNLYERIPEGHYNLLYRTPSTSAFPVVCAYREAAS